MSILTDKEILEMAHDGVFLQSIYEITRDIEAMIIEKIKAQGEVAHLCTNIQSGDVDASVLDPQDIFDWNERELWNLEPLYKLPEGD